MPLAIEATADRVPEPYTFVVRLVDGDQVLAERYINASDPNDQRAWRDARESAEPAPGGIQLAIRTLFPEFGTVPDGVAS